MVGGPILEIDGQCVTFYVDNNGSKWFLTKSDAKYPEIAIPVRIYPTDCDKRGITPLLERAPSNFIIADLPTRGDVIPFKIHSSLDFGVHSNLQKMAKLGLGDGEYGYFDSEILSARSL